MVMAATALLAAKPKPTDADIDCSDDHIAAADLPARCAKRSSRGQGLIGRRP